MKIVVLDGFTSNPGDLSWEGLKKLGVTEIFDRTGSNELLLRCKDADIILTNKTKLNKEIIEKLPNLKYIGVLATGFDVVDVKCAKKRRIPVCNVPDYSSSSVAQTVFALILEITNRVGANSRKIKKWCSSLDFTYSDYKLIELSGKIIGIVGYGNIGRKVAKIAKAFDMEVVVHTRSIPDEKPDDINFVPLSDLLKKSDIVSLNCPLTEQTEGIINSNTLIKMKRNAVLINTARGPLVNEEDLCKALDSNEIYGAALDVLKKEPPNIRNPVFNNKKIIVTPHNAWATHESRKRLLDIVIRNVDAFIKGRPENVINGL